MSSDTGMGTMKFDPHSQDGEQHYPNSQSNVLSEATEFGDAPMGDASAPSMGTQKFEPGHNSGIGHDSAASRPRSNVTSKGKAMPPGSGVRANSSGARRYSTHRSIARKIPWVPVMVTIIGMVVISIVAFFTLFDDVWYNIR